MIQVTLIKLTARFVGDYIVPPSIYHSISNPHRYWHQGNGVNLFQILYKTKKAISDLRNLQYKWIEETKI